MANPYLKTAGGNWSAAATWSATSASGVDNAGPPTAATDVILELLSGAVTIDSGAVCRSININSGTGGYNNTITHSAGVTLTIGDGTAGAGNKALDFSGGGGSFTYTLGNATSSAISFVSTSATQQTITTGGKTLGNVTFNATSNGSWQLADALTMGNSTIFSLTKGSLDINGKTCSIGGLTCNSGSTRSLTFGASSFTTNSSVIMSASGLTFSAGSATFVMNKNNLASSLGALTWGATTINASNTVQLNGATTATFSSLTITGPAAKTGAIQIQTGGGLTTTGTMTINGNSVTNRLLIKTDTIGSSATLTAATIVTKWVDWRDITAAGAANWNLTAQSTNSSGNCGGNTGITFTVAATQTATGTASFSWSTHGWTSRVPLPQDDVVISNAFVAGRTVTLDMPRAGKSITWSNTGNSVAWAKTTTTTIYGSLVMTGTSLMTNSGTTGFTFENRSAATFTSAGQTFTNPVTVACFGSSLTLADAWNNSAGVSLTVTDGTFSDGGFSATFGGQLNSSNASATTRAITISNGITWTFTGTSFWNTSASTGLTLTATGSTIKCTDSTNASLVFATGSLTYGNFYSNRGANTGTLTITGSSTFNNFKDDGTAAHSILFTAGITTTVATFTVTGNGAGNEISINSTTTAVHTLTKSSGGTISCDYLNIQHSVASNANTWYAGTHSINNQAVSTAGSGWIFTAPPSGTATIGNLLMMGV